MKRTISLSCLLAVFLSAGGLNAQSSGVQLHAPAYDIYERMDILGRAGSPVHTELKFFTRKDMAQFALKLNSLEPEQLSGPERQDIQYLLDDNNEWVPDSIRSRRKHTERGLFRYFYRTPANFLEVNTPAFRLRANPMLNFQLAQEQGQGSLVFQNQRGFEIRGDVDRKLFFYTNLLETQASFPGYVSERIDSFTAVPGAGFFKTYNSKLFKVNKGYDFNVATAYLGFQASRHFGLQLGHGRHFIGNGYRSLLLSDFGAPTFFLKMDTRVWKFHYQNLFLELSPVSNVNLPGDSILPKKYAAIHYLNFKVNDRLAFGFFEATIFNRSRQFEFQYLNPVIFYRTVEGMIGSPDNAMLGIDGHWNVARAIQLYGQVLLDELAASEVFSGKGWWANKWGIQAGVKYVNAFGVDHLDLRLEHNRVRPFTYSHNDPANSYTHYNQVLAHPLGANFAETLFMLRWQPVHKLSIQARYIYAKTGDNTAEANWGANPLLSYNSRVQDYGNAIGQGISANLVLAGVDISWALWHNVFADLRFLYRKKNSSDDLSDRSTKLFGAGLRMNLWNPALDF